MEEKIKNYNFIKASLITYFNENFNASFKKDKLLNSKAISKFFKVNQKDLEDVLKNIFPNIKKYHLENYYIVNIKEFKNFIIEFSN